MKLLSLILFAASLSAQPVLTLAGPATAHQGDSISLTLNLSSTAGSKLSGAQWNINYPTGVSLGDPMSLSQGPNSGKGLGLFCAANLQLCMAVGFSGGVVSASTLSDGPLANVSVLLTRATSLGNVSVPLTGILGVDTQAFNVPGIASGPTYTLKVLSLCDRNSDNVINIADVQLIINEALGVIPCGLASGCSVAQVQSVIVTVLGGSCNL